MTNLSTAIGADPPAVSALTLLRPIAQPGELLAYQDEVHALILRTLKEGTDFGVIPGTGNKPVLFKPGAERLNLAFGATPEYSIVEAQVDHDREVRWTKRNKWKGDVEGTSLGLYRYVVRCRLVRSGRPLAECIAICSTLESKFIDRPRDAENTVLKMAQKRGYVGATLNAYALSERFAVDVEDLHENQKATVIDVAPEDEAPAPKPFAAPKAANGRVLYKVEDRSLLNAVLRGKKVPEQFWDEISAKLIGKSMAEADAAIAAVREGTV